MKFYAKTYKEGDNLVVACCDDNIRGKIFEEGELILHVKESFYCGDLLGDSDLRLLLGRATIANMVGDGVVKIAISCGIIDENNVLSIGGVPHAQMVRV